jgi:hypothetical protein
MFDAFFKALKWFLFVGFVIGGIAAMAAVERYGFKYLFMAVLSFGVAYLSAGSWRGLPQAQMLVSLLLIGALAAVAYYIPTIGYILFGQEMRPDFFVTWLALVFIPGVPFMTVVFMKYDD